MPGVYVQSIDTWSVVSGQLVTMSRVALQGGPSSTPPQQQMYSSYGPAYPTTGPVYPAAGQYPGGGARTPHHPGGQPHVGGPAGGAPAPHIHPGTPPPPPTHCTGGTHMPQGEYYTPQTQAVTRTLHQRVSTSMCTSIWLTVLYASQLFFYHLCVSALCWCRPVSSRGLHLSIVLSLGVWRELFNVIVWCIEMYYGLSYTYSQCSQNPAYLDALRLPNLRSD